MAKIDAGTPEGRAKADRRALLVFFVLLAITAFLSAIAISTTEGLRLGNIIVVITGAFQNAFILIGLLEVYYYSRRGHIKGKRLVKIFLVGSLLAAVVILGLVALVQLMGLIEFGAIPTSAAGLASLAAGLYIGGFIAVFIALLIGLLLAIGAIGIMSAIARIVTPWILVKIACSERKSTIDRVVAWVFAIPDALDTRSLTINRSDSEPERIPWNDVKRAVAWEIVLGLVLCVYVSFSTLTSGTEASVIFRMFTLLISASIFVPLIVLPWFIFLGLDAKLKGTVKDFELYDGIKSRIFRSYVAVGTLLIFIRLTLSEVDLETFLTGFASYAASLTVVAFGFSFVFFNFFSFDLSGDIAKDFERIRPKTD